MLCPRCGFPEASEKCPLCGQDEFDNFEMNKHASSSSDRFEFTLSFPKHARFDHILKDPTDITECITSESRPRRFLFFRNGQDRKLVQTLKSVKALGFYELRVNGAPRPYIEELWLPLLDLLADNPG